MGPWVSFAGQARRDGPWSYQAVNQAVMRAERGAWVPQIRWRALHGVQWMLTTNVSSRTGDPALAMQWIGDDVWQATRHIRERAADFRAVADDRGMQ
jgi:hypothetical protein